MRAIFTFLAAAIALVAFAWWLADLPGTVNVAVGTVALSAPTSLAILALLLLVLLLYAAVSLVAGLVRLPRRSRRMRAARNRDRGDQAVSRTLLALAGGDPDSARSAAQRSRRLLGDTPQTLLLSAYAARLGGDTARADQVFNQMADRKDSAFLGLRGLYQGAIARGDWDAANALARQAGDVNPDAPWLRAERERLAIRSGSWKEALSLASKATPVAALGAAAADDEDEPVAARRLAQQAWRADPGFAPAALGYARRLRQAGRERRAQSVLRESWGKNPHPDLGITALDGGSMSREGRAEWLTAANPDHPESLLLRARAALDAGNMPEARRFAEAARAGGFVERRLWLLLAAIAARENNTDAASDALHQAASATADSHWRCDACGAPQVEWHPVCSRCSEAATITWGTHAGRTAAPRLAVADAGDTILS